MPNPLMIPDSKVKWGYQLDGATSELVVLMSIDNGATWFEYMRLPKSALVPM